MSEDRLTLEIEPHHFQQLTGEEKRKAFALLELQQQEYSAKRFEVESEAKSKLGFLHTQHSYRLKNNLNIILHKKGLIEHLHPRLRMFGPTSRMPMRRKNNVLRARPKRIIARVFDNQAFILVNPKGHILHKIMRAFFGISSAPEPDPIVYRVDRRLFDELYYAPEPH